MQKQIVSLLVAGLVIFVTSSPIAAAVAGKYRRYGVKSGIVEFKVSGNQNGMGTIYFDDYGAKEARYQNIEISMMGMTQASNTLVIIDRDVMYNVNLDTKTGGKSVDATTPQMLENTGAANLQELGMHMIQQMGGEQAGVDTVAGVTCDIWKIPNVNSESCIYKGISLKTSMSMGNMEMLMEATSFQEGANIPEDKFKLPGDVQILDAPNLEEIQKMMEQMNSHGGPQAVPPAEGSPEGGY